MNKNRRELRKVNQEKTVKVLVTRRIAKCRVTPEMIGEMFKRMARITMLDGTEFLIEHGIPQDAKCVGVYSNPQDATLQFYFESPEFEAIPTGGVLPEISVDISELKEEEEVNVSQAETVQG